MALGTRIYSSLILACLALSCGDSSPSKKAPKADRPPAVTNTNAGPSPRIVDFSSPHGGVDFGDDVELRWKADGANLCKLENASVRTILPSADNLPAEGSIALNFGLFKDQPLVSLRLICMNGSRTAEQSLVVPVAQLETFQVDQRTPKTNDSIILSWSAKDMKGACTLDGQAVVGSFKKLLIADQPKTTRTIRLSCPGYKKNFEQEITIYILPANRLLWYLASEFTFNGNLIDADLDATHQVTGDEPMKLSWQMGEGVTCSAKNGFGDDARSLDMTTEGRKASVTMDQLMGSTVIIRCEAESGRYPQNNTSIYLTIKRRTATIGAISQSTMINQNLKEGYSDPKPVFGGDTFRLYAQLQNLDAGKCKMGLEGETGGELEEIWPYKISFSKQTYRKPQGDVKGWIECQMADGVYKKEFSLTLADASKQTCPKAFIKIYDKSQLSLPAACPNVPLVLMSLDSKVWETERTSSHPLKVKLSDGQAFYATFHLDIDRYGSGIEPNYRLENLLFSYDYLHRLDVSLPLQIEIEGGPAGQLESLHFSVVQTTKITARNIRAVTHDLTFVSNTSADIELPALESAGYLMAAGNKKVQVHAPRLTKITGSGRGAITEDNARGQPSIGGIYLYRNISLLIEAALESVRGGFTVEGNIGDVSLVPPGISAAGLIQQPLKEILKAPVPADTAKLLHTRMNGSLLISGNEVLQKVLLPQLTRIEDGGVIGRFSNLPLLTEYTREGTPLNSGENPRLVELDLSQLKRDIKVLPSEFNLDLGELAGKEGFDEQFYIIKDPLLKF